MKRVSLWLALIVCMAFAGSALLSAEGPLPIDTTPAPKVRDGERPKGDVPKDTGVKKEGGDDAKGDFVKKEGDGKKGPVLGEIGNKMNKIVTLSDEQKAQIAELNKARETAIKEANDKFTQAALALMTDEQKAAWRQATTRKEGEKPKGDVQKEGASKEGDAPKKEGKVKDGGGDSK